MKTNSTSLETFIRRTQKLSRELRALMTRYPEDHMEPDQRIFNRLLTTDWRYLPGYHGPVELRYSKAAEWVKALDSYDSDLREFCRYELNAPTKLKELPMQPWLRLSGAECLHLLELQGKALRRWRDAISPANSRLTQIRRDLQAVVDERGVKTVAAEIPVNVDTLRDLLAEKTNPHGETMKAIASYLKRQKSNG